MVKIRTPKSQLFLQESAPSPFKCRLFSPKVHLKSVEGQAGKRELTIESFLINGVCTQRLLEDF